MWTAAVYRRRLWIILRKTEWLCGRMGEILDRIAAINVPTVMLVSVENVN